MAGPHHIGFSSGDDTPVFVISVAAELAGMHAQTLRQYDRLGLVTPQRTSGGGRRYSVRDVTRLRQVQSLSQEDGVSLAGIQRIMELEEQVERLQDELAHLREALNRLRAAQGGTPRFFAVGTHGEVVALRPGQRPSRPSQAIVVWDPLAVPPH